MIAAFRDAAASRRGIVLASLEKAPKTEDFSLGNSVTGRAKLSTIELRNILMNYFKSVLVGLAAVFVICVFLPALPAIVHILIVAIRYYPDSIAIKVSPWSWRAPSHAQWLFMFTVFGGGFFWELRSLAKRRLPPATDSANPPIS